MTETNDDFEIFLEKVRAKLPEYLESKGITWDDHGWFKCFHPEHNEDTPSAHFVEVSGVPNQTRFKCFGCHRSGDIFSAATWLDKRPTEGKGWLVENVFWIADKFGIPHEQAELTESEYIVLRQQRLYDDTADLLVNLCEENHTYYGNALKRGIWKETCKDFGIGSVPWKSMLTALKDQGWEEGFIRASGIDEAHFDDRYLTFTLRNMNGKVVGFDRRYMDYDLERQKAFKKAGQFYPPKYQATSQKKCRLIQKEVLLYNVHWARKRSLKRLDVFEGFTDWITAYQAGHDCCTAVCGSHLTEMMVAVMRSCGFSHINLVYDSDSTGMTEMEKALEKFKEQEGLHITIMPLAFHENVPNGQRDVDYYIRSWPSLEEGLSNFHKHQPITAFDWLLDQRVRGGVEPSLIAKEMVGFIVNERSQVDRGMLCSRLAHRLAIPEQDVREEVEAIANHKFDEFCNMAALRIKRASSTSQRVAALKAAYEQVTSIERSSSDTSHDPAESVEFIRATLDEFKSTEKGILGWKTGWTNFDRDMGGVPKSKQILVFGGVANAGKSSLLINSSVGLIKNNDEPTVIYFSLDDPRRTMQGRFLSVISGMPTQWCVQPQEYIYEEEKRKKIYDAACDELMTMAEEGRLILKGMEAGNTVESFENVIKTTQERLGRPCVVMVDSFHSIGGGSDQERINFKRVAEWCQRTTDQLDYTLVCTAECTKAASEVDRPRMFHLGETVKLAYAAKLVGMVHNDKNHKFNQTSRLWDDDGTPRAILEVHAEKNKITSFKDTWYYKLREPTAELFETTEEELLSVKPTKAGPPQGTPGSFDRPPQRPET